MTKDNLQTTDHDCGANGVNADNRQVFLSKKGIEITNIKIASTVIDGTRIYFRLVPMEELKEFFIGTMIVCFHKKYSQFPTGILVHIAKKYFIIESPDHEGQRLCINKDDCYGFSLLRCLREDLVNEDFQTHPENYTDDFKSPEK